MNGTSNTASQIISLPKGGGALSGIGEKFAPDLFTGTGNFTIPFAIPPGRNAFQPHLELIYSTGSGNGPFGLGWSLSIPGIARKTAKGIPRYDDALDTFILSGAEDLIPIADIPPAATLYRPRTEGLFAQILHHHKQENDYWEVKSKDGLISLYGKTDASENQTAAISDPQFPSHLFAWKLTRTIDSFGNRIEYAYTQDPVREDGCHRWNQIYLSQIHYVDYGDIDNPQFLVTVEFEYESRPDPFSDYRAGFEIRIMQRCIRIRVLTHADAPTPVRTYHLDYLPVEQAGLNGLSMLSQIRVEGHGEAGSEWLPALELEYAGFNPENSGRRSFFPVTGTDLPPGSLGRPGYDLVDLTGNGLPDILEMDGAVRYWRNQGGGRFNIPRDMPDAPAGIRLSDQGVQILDANGDGCADLLVTTGKIGGYYPLQFGGLWNRSSFQEYRSLPSFDLKDPEVRLVDLDGDGVTDAVRCGSRLECFFNDPKEGWTETCVLERQALESFPNVTLSDTRIRWADMTGDGLKDIVMIHDGSIEYWPSLGRGKWARRVQMRNCPRFPYGYDPKRILIGDVDGDGLADLIYVEDTKITLWINQSGNEWSNPVQIQGMPSVSDAGDVRLVDLLGTGVSGILWSADAGGPARESMYFLDLTGGIKPYLLNKMDNHMGAVTIVDYAPSTRYYLEDEQKPEMRWKTPLPFPVQVVARVEVIDKVSRGKLTTEYSYHHGYWDGAEREFRGFGRVDHRDTQVFDDYHAAGLHLLEQSFNKIPKHIFSPPTEMRTWFHQGPTGDEYGEWEETDYSGEYWEGDIQLLERPSEMISFLKALPRRAKRDALRALRGRMLRTELYALDGTDRENRPYTVTESLHGVSGLPISTGGPAEPAELEEWQLQVFFPHLLAERTTQWERGDDPMAQVTFTDHYDEFGQPLQQTIVNLPRLKTCRHQVTGAVVGSVAVDETRILAIHKQTEYAVPDDGLYIHDRVSEVQTFELDPAPVITETGAINPAQELEEQVAAARQAKDKIQSLLQSWQAGRALPSELHIVGHVLNHYDGQSFEGRSVGQVGPYGALTRSEALVFTNDDLNKAYGDRIPAYLGGNAALPPGAPAGFGTDLGYRRKEAASPPYHDGYYADVKRQQFDFQGITSQASRGVVTAVQDPLGNQVEIIPDTYRLFAAKVIDAVGLTIEAQYNYHVMQPCRVTNANGNATRYIHTALGLLHKVIMEGREGEGGSDDKPEIEHNYDFHTFECTRGEEHPQPVYVHVVQRICHAHDPDLCDDVIEAREYSDGFGRMIQKRAQAEDLVFGPTGDDAGLSPKAGDSCGPANGQHVVDRVVVSGWQVHDNKGQVVEKYEPFFSSGWSYQPAEEARQGQHATMFYDPRGHVIRTVHPDGSEQRVIFGIPADLTDPNTFTPTPWETYTYDPNDLAPLSRNPVTQLTLEDRAPASHNFTPTSTLLDGLGRTICKIDRNGRQPHIDWYVTRSTYDIRGNLLTVMDPLGRIAFQHQYDLLNRSLRVISIDAGTRTTVMDAAGNPVEYRDSKGSIVLRQHDALNRPTHLWAHDAGEEIITLRERLEYGDGSNNNQPPDERANNQKVNRLGKLWKHYDEAGLLEYEHYDFKENVLEKTRTVISDTAMANGWVADWSAPDSYTALDTTVSYQTTLRYDALNRVVEHAYPADISGIRAIITPHYNRAGELECVTLDGDDYVRHIAYNAKGQRVLIEYGNNIMTRYLYDPLTFRLRRLRTERRSKSGAEPDIWEGEGGASVCQDFIYEYDLTGNITTIRDRAPDCGVPGTPLGVNAIDRAFEYDALYRLTRATGRECDLPPTPPWDDTPRCSDITRTRYYTEDYAYDEVGNIKALGHGPGIGAFNREFMLAPGTNRLAGVIDAGVNRSYLYDDNGNMIRENAERHFTWDHSDRMISFANRPTPASPASVEVRYLYAADGMRVKKWVGKNGAGEGESTIYIDGVFEHHHWKKPGEQGQENNLIHVMDDQSRIAIVRRGPAHPDGADEPVQYHFGDHLGSSNIVVNESGTWANREEYTPYGETSFGSFAKKRYRLAGRERDEENNLYYNAARYYVPWLAKWLNCDPARPAEKLNMLNLYEYCKSNPVLFGDKEGLQPERSSDTAFQLEQPSLLRDNLTWPSHIIPPLSPPQIDISNKGQFAAPFAYAPQGSAITEYDNMFAGQSGQRFANAVQNAAALMGIDPGLLAVNARTEAEVAIYTGHGTVRSFHVGEDDFYGMVGAISKKVPLAGLSNWHRPPGLSDVNEKNRRVNSVIFESGDDALRGMAAHLKYIEETLREKSGVTKEGQSKFDILPIETRFYLMRLAFNAGQRAALKDLNKALKGETIPIKTLAGRRAVLHAMQAVHISESYFGTTPHLWQ